MTISGLSGLSGMMGNMDISAIQQRQEQRFAEIDQNGDGSLDKTEFQSVVDMISSKTGETVDIDEAFSRIDTNSDGVIDQSELEADFKSHMESMMSSGALPMNSESTTSTLLEMLSSMEEEDSLSPTETYLQNYYNNAEEQSILDLLG